MVSPCPNCYDTGEYVVRYLHLDGRKTVRLEACHHCHYLERTMTSHHAPDVRSGATRYALRLGYQTIDHLIAGEPNSARRTWQRAVEKRYEIRPDAEDALEFGRITQQANAEGRAYGLIFHSYGSRTDEQADESTGTRVQITVEQVLDDATLDDVLDAVNEIARVARVEVVRAR